MCSSQSFLRFNFGTLVGMGGTISLLLFPHHMPCTPFLWVRETELYCPLAHQWESRGLPLVGRKFRVSSLWDGILP